VLQAVFGEFKGDAQNLYGNTTLNNVVIMRSWLYYPTKPIITKNQRFAEPAQGMGETENVNRVLEELDQLTVRIGKYERLTQTLRGVNAQSSA
jgi:hypothetical protein